MEKKAIDWMSILGWKNEDLDDLRFIGYTYIKQAHYEIAEKIFEGLLELCDNSAYDKQTLGAIYLEKGENLKALKMIDQALELDPNDGNTLLNRAKALFLLGYTSQGITLCRTLKNRKEEAIKNDAEALILGYS